MEPTRQAYSREEMRDALTSWLVKDRGKPNDLSPKERKHWHQDWGLIYSFIHDHFPSNNPMSEIHQRFEDLP